jgi:hypothetical protein
VLQWARGAALGAARMSSAARQPPWRRQQQEHHHQLSSTSGSRTAASGPAAAAGAGAVDSTRDSRRRSGQGEWTNRTSSSSGSARAACNGSSSRASSSSGTFAQLRAAVPCAMARLVLPTAAAPSMAQQAQRLQRRGHRERKGGEAGELGMQLHAHATRGRGLNFLNDRRRRKTLNILPCMAVAVAAGPLALSAHTLCHLRRVCVQSPVGTAQAARRRRIGSVPLSVPQCTELYRHTLPAGKLLSAGHTRDRCATTAAAGERDESLHVS